MIRLWNWLVFQWKYPYGKCEIHNEREGMYLGCWSCYKEQIKESKYREREEKIELIKDGVLRALNSQKES